jgi:hypothetical protein
MNPIPIRDILERVAGRARRQVSVSLLYEGSANIGDRGVRSQEHDRHHLERAKAAAADDER